MQLGGFIRRDCLFGFYCRRLHILPDYTNRSHFVQLTNTALLAYLRLGQVATYLEVECFNTS
jgi:hypothetical protein